MADERNLPKETYQQSARRHIGRLRLALEDIANVCTRDPQQLCNEVVIPLIEAAEKNFSLFLHVSIAFGMAPSATSAFDNQLANFREDTTEHITDPSLTAEQKIAEILPFCDQIIDDMAFYCRNGWSDLLYGDQEWYHLTTRDNLPIPTATEIQQEPPMPPLHIMKNLPPPTINQSNLPTGKWTGRQPWWYQGPERPVVYEDKFIKLRMHDIINLPSNYLVLKGPRRGGFASYYEVKGADQNRRIYVAKGSVTTGIAIDEIKDVWLASGNAGSTIIYQ